MTLTVLPILEVAPSAVREDTPLFLTPAYNRLYLDKGYAVNQYLFEDRGQALGVVFGLKDNSLTSPFSAPFGGLWPIDAEPAYQDYLDAIDALIQYADDNQLTKIQITLPPGCYDERLLDSQRLALIESGFETVYTDTNHSFDLTAGEFEAGLHRGARRSLDKARMAGLTFKQATSEPDQRRVYEAIKLNRQQRRNPLHLSFEDIATVSKISEVDFFLIEHEGTCVAGAVVYRVSSKVAQVIYWGNDTNKNLLNSVHFLAMKLFQHYQQDYEILDIGPSSSRGVLDEGLASFKESIGCTASLKFTLAFSAGP